MAETIAVLSLKGGTGKTTTVRTLADVLRRVGLDVLAIDLDGDGIDEVVVPQNQIPGRIAVVYKGPAGYRFQTVNSGFEGTVTALGALRGEGTGPSLVLAVARYYGVLSSSGETSIVMTLPE